MVIATKRCSMVNCFDVLLPIKSHDTLITWSCKITWQSKTVISSLCLLEVLPTIKSYNALITWSCKVMWQAKTIISLLPDCLWPPNFAGWYLTLTGFYPQSHVNLWSRGLERSWDKLNYISTITVPMATSLGRMVTYFEQLLTIKSFNPLITWSYEITWQTKVIMSPLP